MSMKSSIDLVAAPQGRKKPRRRVNLCGVITYGDGTYSFRCTVRNLTEIGAGLSFTEPRLLPPRLHLINMRDQIAYEALTIWVNGREAGVVFVDRFPLAEVADDLAYLKKLWNGSAERGWAPEQSL